MSDDQLSIYGEPGQPPYGRDDALIRAKILGVPGSRACDRYPCSVITQGGTDGYQAHLRKVHGE